MSGRCTRCNGRVYDSREYVAGMCSFVTVRVCQSCGDRQYGQSGAIDLERWKPDFSEDQKIEKTTIRKVVKMGKKPKRECANCGRTMAIVGRGLCGTCLKKHKENGTLDELFPAKTKTKAAAGPVEEKEPEPFRGSPETVREIINQQQEKQSRKKTGPDFYEPYLEHKDKFGVFIAVEERDEDLFSHLEKWAKDDRRSLSDQILFALENIVYERTRQEAS